MKPDKKPKWLKWQEKWDQSKMIAQQRVDTLRNKNWQKMQLVLMCANNTPVAGYVQSSDKEIINDDSIQSPLILNK